MEVKSIKFEKLVSLGNFENQKIGIEVALEAGESPSEALRRAQTFIEKALAPKPRDVEIKQAERIVANPDDWAPKQVREAQELLSSLGEEIPF